MSRRLIATYEMIKNYRYKPTNYWLAISEFIDNSIGSYQKNNIKNPIDGLVINITLDWRDDNNWKITVLDNALGMSPDKLEESMQPCDRTGKSDTQYNQYGVGMKLGIFWYGENGRVYSKQVNKQEYKVDLMTDNVKDQDEVIVTSIKSTENKIPYESGTYIEISKIYKERNIVDQKNALKKLESALGWRYNHLIEKGLKIYLTILAKDSNKNINNLLIKPYFNNHFRLEQLFDENKISKIVLEQRKKEWANNIEKLKSKNKSEFFKTILYKVINNEPVEATKKITINGHDVDLIVSIIDANKPHKNQYCGLTIYHMDRAILHGPNDENSHNFQFVDKSFSSTSNPTSRWLYGELNLTGIENPDENKSRFMWSENGEADLKDELKEVFKELEEILEIIAKINNITTNKKPNKTELNKIANNIPEKIKVFSAPKIIERGDGQKGISGICNIFDEKFAVEVFESDDINFLECDADDINKKLTIYIERENRFWKPFILQAEFKKELLYPIAIYLGVSEWIYNNEKVIKKYDEFGGKTFIQILNTIIKEWS